MNFQGLFEDLQLHNNWTGDAVATPRPCKHITELGVAWSLCDTELVWLQWVWIGTDTVESGVDGAA